MKMIMKKFTAFICVLSLVFGSIAITPVINAEAEEAGFQMRAGASVRISTDTGIRFAVEISSPVREELFTEDGETRTLKENVEIGMIIVPKRVIDSATGDYFNYFSTNYGKSKEQISAQFTAGQFKVDGEKLYATAAIVNIKDKNFVQEYQAVAYYTTDAGATYTYTAKSDARTIGYVADRALADTTDYSSTSSKMVGYLLEKFIKLSKTNDLTLTKNRGDSLNLFNEFAAGLENTSQFVFALKHSSSNVTVKDSTLKAKNEGYATVTMKGYDELVDLEIPVNVVAENSAPETGTKVYYSGANGNVYADVLTSDMIGVENGTPLTIDGRTAAMKASIDITEDIYTENSVYTAYLKLGVSKVQIQRWIEEGYTELVIPYYLSDASTAGTAIYNLDWTVNVAATKNEWSELRYPLQWVYDNYDKIQEATGENFFLQILIKSSGTYEFYLGGAEATKNELNLDTTVLESISSHYASVNGESAFVIEENQTLNDVEAQYKISGEVTSDYYAKGGAISVYANLGVTKSVIKKWLDAGYEQLKLTYYLDTDSECAVSLYAMDKNELNTQVAKNAWSECYLDLLYIHDYYEQIQEGVGDNYLLRIEPQEAGIYAFYIGNCEPVQDTLVNLSGSFYYYNVGDGSGQDVNIETEQSEAEKALDLIVDDKMAEWKAGPVTLTSSDVHGDGYFHVFLNLGFTKEQLQGWIDSGATHLTMPYYFKTDGSQGIVFGDGTWSGAFWESAKTNEWAEFKLPLSWILTNYDAIQAGTNSWLLVLPTTMAGTYELFFGKTEIVTTEATSNTQVITKGNGLSYWWYGTSEHYGSATITENVEVDGKNADIQATITISDSDFNSGMNLSAYYKFGIEKEQIQSWVDEGYTELTVPYYLKVENGGAVSAIWADYDDSEEDASLAWIRYLNVTPVTDTWSSFTIDLDDLLLRYDNVQKATGEGYLFRLTPTAAGTYTLYTGAAGVYCEKTITTRTESTHMKEMTATSSTIIASGASDYEILVPSDASEELHTAAEELQFFLKEATGVELPIISQAKTDGKYFSLGNTRLAKLQGLEGDEEVLGTEGYQIKTVDNNVYIYAADDTGVLYGVYGYLELALNYDFFFTDVYTIDNVDTLVLHNFNVTDVPDIENRIASYGFQMMDETTRMRMRMSNYVETLTGADGSAFHNSFDYLPKETYQTKYPNWYSDDDTQLCYTAHGNAEELAKMQETIANAMYKTLISQKYEDYHKIVLALEDDTGWCTCAACAKTKSSYGVDSASVILFYNEVAELLEAKLRMAGDERAETFELIFYAYYAIEDAPVTVSTNGNGETVYSYRPEMKLNYHVSPLYAPIYADFSKPFTTETNKQYLETMQKWNAISESMHMWGYDTFFNNRGYLLPYNSWDSLDDLYKVAYENGVDWMFLQGQSNNVASSGFTLLKGYLQSKLSWDVNADVNALTEKFFDAMYGAQADTVQGVYESIKTHMNGLSSDAFWPQVNSEDRNNDGHFDSSNWPETTLENWYSTLETAERALTAAGDTEGAKRIRLEEANILSLLLEAHYVMIDSTSDTWRTYNTLKSGFSDYRNKFGDIVTEWNIENAAENDWTMATYLEMLDYSN